MRFEVKLNSETIGFTELEGGDPPMGVAFGRLSPTPAYTSIQQYCIEHRDYWIAPAGLTVQTDTGVSTECSGLIQIIDFSPEMGEAGIQIHLNGVVKLPYGDLFAHHQKAYRERWQTESC